MKKLLFSALVIAATFTSAFVTEVKINRTVSTAFARDYALAKQVVWVSTPDYVKASFTENDKNIDVFYNHDGVKIGVSSGISIEQLPISAKRIFAKKYGAYSVREAIEFTTEDETTYFLNVANDKEKLILKVNSLSVEVFKRL